MARQSFYRGIPLFPRHDPVFSRITLLGLGRGALVTKTGAPGSSVYCGQQGRRGSQVLQLKSVMAGPA